MTLARLCPHDVMGEHEAWRFDDGPGVKRFVCPGGVVLDPEQTRGPFDWCMFHDSLATHNPGRCFVVSVGHGDAADCDFEVMQLVPLDALAAAQEGKT